MTQITCESRALVGPEVPVIRFEGQFLDRADDRGRARFCCQSGTGPSDERMVPPVISDFDCSRIADHGIPELENIGVRNGGGLFHEDPMA